MTSAARVEGVDVSIMVGLSRPWADVLRVAQAADEAGFHCVYVPDHFMPNTPDGAVSDGPWLEAWTCVSALAPLTSRCRLGTLVLGGTYRHPAVVANMVTALDQVSGGRAVAGLGAGWQVNEHAAFGIDLMSPADRSDRFEESVTVVASMLREERTTFHGRFFDITDAPNQPRPVQDRLPVLVAGAGPRRTLRTVARHADVWHVWGTPESFAASSAVLEQRCEEAGRDPASIRRATGAFLQDLADPVAAIAPYAGVCEEYVVGDARGPLPDLLGAIERLGSQGG